MNKFERALIRLTALGIVLAVATGAIFYAQLKWIAAQTLIMQSQSEGANAGALMDEMNTRKQLALGQQQADAATVAVKQAATDSAENARRIERQLKIWQDQAKAVQEQANIAQQAMNASIQSAQQDRRPWVGLREFHCEHCTSDIKPPSEPRKLGERLSVIETVKIGNMFGTMENTGKTPAIRMIVKAALTDRKGSDPIPDYDSVFSKPISRPISPSIPADMAAEIAQTYELIERYRGDAPTVLPPNAPRALPIIGGLQMERNSAVDIADKKIIYVVGKITYYGTDTVTEFVTTFCLMNEIGADFRFCPTGNDMK